MMPRIQVLFAVLAFTGLAAAPVPTGFAFAQAPTAAAGSTASEQPPAPLSDDELEVLVARIALYPDELVALICEASLYPLQIVEASRFLDRLVRDSSLQPKGSWDGSVISLLNYPEIVRMMSDDLDWTQTLSDALTYQQKDVLAAIQQLREKAMAAGAIKSDDKLKVVEKDNTVVIQSASSEVVYVPRYQPEMLYAPDYLMAPVTYYPDPYPLYYYPTATFFAGAVTGAIWAAAVDWNNWGVWGGRWNGGDINIDCNNCFNNIKGRINFNDVDWTKVDRSKIRLDRDQIQKFDREGMRDRLKTNSRNDLRSKTAEIRNERPNALPDRASKVSDVRKDKIRANVGDADGTKRDVKKPAGSTSKIERPKTSKTADKIDRPVGKRKPASKLDDRPKNISGLGEVKRGQREAIASKRGKHSMGGGALGRGGEHKVIRRRDGRRH